MSPHKTIFVLGPTASGKSSLSAQLAKYLQGEVINGDSVQVYEGLEIGAAAPTQEELSQCSHHLYGTVRAGERWTAADYLQAVKTLVSGDERTWVVCGGSGFYLQALLNGMDNLPSLSDLEKQQVLAEIEAMGWALACEKLHSYGDRFLHIHENDHYRVRRGWEIVHQEKKEAHGQSRIDSPFSEDKVIKIGLQWDKDVLRERVYQRSHQMLESGFIDEVKGLVQRGLEHWSPLSSVGYLQVMQHLRGELSERELPEAITQATMKLVKKQMTWFQKDKGIHWVPGDDSQLLELTISLVANDS